MAPHYCCTSSPSRPTPPSPPHLTALVKDNKERNSNVMEEQRWIKETEVSFVDGEKRFMTGSNMTDLLKEDTKEMFVSLHDPFQLL